MVRAETAMTAAANAFRFMITSWTRRGTGTSRKTGAFMHDYQYNNDSRRERPTEHPRHRKCAAHCGPQTPAKRLYIFQNQWVKPGVAFLDSPESPQYGPRGFSGR